MRYRTFGIQETIKDYINNKKRVAFGDLVKNLNYSYSEILYNVIALKEKGTITKSKDSFGYYTIAKP